MSSSKIDAIVKRYRTLTQIPALVGARYFEKDSIGTISSHWTQRNLEEESTTKFLKNVFVSPDFKLLGEVFPVDITKEIMSSCSKSDKYRAVLTKNKDSNQFLTIWKNNSLFRSIDLKSLDLHGDVYSDAEFASFEWSPDETKLLFVAEKKVPKKAVIYKRKNETDEKKEELQKSAGEEFVQDWGEQLVGKKKSILVQYNITSDNIEILSTPEEICVAQPTWSPDGSYIMGIAYHTTPRKLGLIYCSNRPSSLFKLEIDGTYSELFFDSLSVKAPRFTPDGSTLIWLQRRAGGPHHACMQLMKCKTDYISPPEVIVDIVQHNKVIANNKLFYGLYNTAFTKRFWAADNKRLILSTNQKNTVNTYCIDIESKTITEFEYANGNQVVLDVKNDVILVSRRNVLIPDILAIGKLPAKGLESSIKWTEVTDSKIVEGLENYTYNYLNLIQDNPNDPVREFSAIYLGPKSGDKSSVPLIVWPHGGPHSSFANNLSLEGTIFSSLGYAILQVNYRGSVGAGQANVTSLPGNCGTNDVSDCVLAVRHALSEYPWLDGSRVALVGGSHGGFLVTHLAGQYPDMFRVVVARNPVTDIATMSGSSDIPDWCYVECGFDYTQKGPISDDILLAMRRSSPIIHAHKVKAPTLLQIGTKDLRVPPSQGTDYYHALRANGITVKMNVYDDNHPLGTVPNEMENIVSTILWIEEHMGKV